MKLLKLAYQKAKWMEAYNAGLISFRELNERLARKGLCAVHSDNGSVKVKPAGGKR